MMAPCLYAVVGDDGDFSFIPPFSRMLHEVSWMRQAQHMIHRVTGDLVHPEDLCFFVLTFCDYSDDILQNFLMQGDGKFLSLSVWIKISHANTIAVSPNNPPPRPHLPDTIINRDNSSASCILTLTEAARARSFRGPRWKSRLRPMGEQKRMSSLFSSNGERDKAWSWDPVAPAKVHCSGPKSAHMSDLEKQRCGGALAGKTARSCDGCARCRARWYCAADDAFLCQTCDSSVHSANPLARRHRRLRLKYSWCSSGAAALDGNEEEDEENFDGPSWLRGFKRKARTPRKGKKGMAPRPPELAETSPSVEEEQLLYCVPGFDPATAEFRSASSGNEDTKPPVESDGSTPSSTTTVDAADRMAEYMPSDVEIAEFAANMESLLGEASGDDAAFSMERLGLLDNANYFTKELKAEPADEAEQNYPVSDELDKDMTRDSLELDFNCPGSSSTAEEEDELDVEKTEDQHDEPKTARLRLDYEAVISAWSANGSSPWTDGERPQINLANCWNDCMGEAADAAVREEDTVRGITTCFCPCVTFGQVAEIVDKGSCSCGANGALYALIMFATGGCACVYSCCYRSKLRAQYGLREEPCPDCLIHCCCCECCSLAQMYRELNRRGFDMSIGALAREHGKAGTNGNDIAAAASSHGPLKADRH
ncbi:hypothetical protein ZIOFF_004226 [Zingiber officinale]|uniref:B box-type domain-containing protein n=1 Tax=Zingiber officinale TaxID=94328 RepID=A0A8J5LX85_ZINOF|nr:hypothetical protein ZIOFF_004226 [Zingiber officinale]